MQHTWLRNPRRARKADEDVAAFAPHDLAGLFTAPRWLRDLGQSAWLAVGIALFVVGVVWLLALTETIVTPFITGAIVAAVGSPVVRRLERRGVGRGLGSALLLLALVVLSALMALFVLTGITSQLDDLASQLGSAKDTLAGWLTDLGVDPGTATTAKEDVSDAASNAVPALLNGVGEGLRSLSSLIVFLGFAFLSAFFLLKDGPMIRHWIEGHMRVPRDVAHGIGQRVLQSLRGYFVGVTAVAAFNAVFVTIGALLLGVPLVGSIALVTFLGAYVPYLGAWGAGIFSVLIALGGGGADAAIGMAVVQLLGNGMLQQLVQPIAYGAALGIHPLAVLLVTIGAGSLFGVVGLILAAPLTAAATRIAADLSRARTEEERPEPEPEPSVAPT